MDAATKSQLTNLGALPVRVAALETSGTTGSIALLEVRDGPIVYTDRKLPDDQRTARSLLPCLKQALEELKEAERIDPHAVELFLYHGEIAAELGRFEEAEGALRQAAKLLGPADRRALDALRDLATKRKKRR